MLDEKMFTVRFGIFGGFDGKSQASVEVPCDNQTAIEMLDKVLEMAKAYSSSAIVSIATKKAEKEKQKANKENKEPTN